jgi:hypothetical protein
VRPVGTLSRIVEVSSIAEGSSSIEFDEMGQKVVTPGKPVTKSEDLVKRLLIDNITLIDLLAAVSEEAETQRQYATANIVQDLMESHGKFVWMLRSFIEKTSKLSIEDSVETPIPVPVEEPVPTEIPLVQPQ